MEKAFTACDCNAELGININAGRAWRPCGCNCSNREEETREPRATELARLNKSESFSWNYTLYLHMEWEAIGEKQLLSTSGLQVQWHMGACKYIHSNTERVGERSTKCNGFMPAISALRKCANIYTQTQKNFMPTISALKRVKAKGSKV